jgi:hypothetical protein
MDNFTLPTNFAAASMHEQSNLKEIHSTTAEYFLLTDRYLHSVQTESGAHTASYPMGTGGKTAGV